MKNSCFYVVGSTVNNQWIYQWDQMHHHSYGTTEYRPNGSFEWSLYQNWEHLALNGHCIKIGNTSLWMVTVSKLGTPRFEWSLYQNWEHLALNGHYQNWEHLALNGHCIKIGNTSLWMVTVSKLGTPRFEWSLYQNWEHLALNGHYQNWEHLALNGHCIKIIITECDNDSFLYFWFEGCVPFIIHWGQDKMAAIFRMTFSNAFSWTMRYEFRLRFHWNFKCFEGSK